MQRQLIGVIANNVLGKATKIKNGKYWYSYGTISEIGEYNSYRQQIEELRQLYTHIEDGKNIYN